MDRTSVGPRLSRAGLYIFIVALAADLIFTATGADSLRLLSKPLIVPGLFFYFTALTTTKEPPHRWIFPALLFSWLGDVFLLFENSAPLFFILGLSSFLIAHIFYCIFLMGVWKVEKLKLHQPFLIGVSVYYAGLITLLWPGLGALKVPVLLYGAVISAMLLLALHTVLLRGSAARILMPGAVLFVLSDSVLAVNRFLHPVPLAGIFIMLTYGLAQLLLVRGALAFRPRKANRDHTGMPAKQH